MAVSRKFELTAIFFLTLLNSQCSDYPISNEIEPQLHETRNEEIMKCATSQTQHDFEVHDQKRGTSNNPIPMMVQVVAGDDFTYECCDNGNVSSIDRFGSYEPDSIKLICRVEVNKKGPCTVQWVKHFNASRYHGRIFIEYNITANCMLWRIHNVSFGDENSFVAMKRDNLMDHFMPCIPVTLNVTEAPSPPVPTTHLNLSTTPKTLLPTSGISTTRTPSIPVPTTKKMKPGSPSASLTGWRRTALIIGVILSLIFIAIVLICICKLRNMSSSKTTTPEDETRDNSEYTSVRLISEVETSSGHVDYGSIDSKIHDHIEMT